MQQKGIHWFPGHMKKAMREIEERIKLIDVIIEVIDSRVPRSSKNKYLEQITQGKKRILVMSKKDLSDSNIVSKWVEKYKEEGYYTVVADLNNKNDINLILKAIDFAGEERKQKYIKKGMKPQPLRLMIIGIPNVGKSTLINRLSKRSSASIANTPGHTRAQQWIRSSSFELLDTPGILPPSYDNNTEALKLALIGAMKLENLSSSDLASKLLNYLIKNHRDALKNKYDLSDEIIENKEEVFEGIAKRRGLLLGEGKYDIDRAEILLLKEFKEGLIVKVVLDEVC